MAAERALQTTVADVTALVADLPGAQRKHKGTPVTVRSGVVAVPPKLAKAILAQKSALTRSIDSQHVAALREAMSGGRWVEDSSVIQLHVADGADPHLFVVDGAHRLAAIAGGRKAVPTLVVVRQFPSVNRDADVESYDATNAQKAQSLTARAKTIARRTAPEGWADAEKADKPAIRGAVRYGTLVQQGYKFGARRAARNLPMGRVMEAAFEVFPIATKLSAAARAGQGPVPRLLAADAVIALLILAERGGLDAEAFVAEAIKPGPIQRELAKVAGRKHAGGSGAIIEVQAVAAALLWKAGRSEAEALRAVYQDRVAEIGGVRVSF